jgi:DNA-binding winged helix-turn-helix (wHTH) protein/Tol biopolymer transport system component
MTLLKNDPQPASPKLRFGVFEVDPRSGELRKHGVRISIQPRPFQALLVLLQRANEVVTREELQKHLWSPDVFVDFEHGLNTAIRKVRRALNDDAEKPRFIETLGRQGYRFLVPVEPEHRIQEPRPAQLEPLSQEAGAFALAEHEDEDVQLTLDPPYNPSGNASRRAGSFWILTVLVFVAILLTVYLLRPLMPSPRVTRVTQITKSGAAWYLEPLYTDGPRLYYQSAGPELADWQFRQVLLNGNEDTPTGIPSRFRIRGLSPDDTEFVAIVTTKESSTVWSLPVAGGSARRVGNLMAGDVAWSHDGNWFAYAQNNQLLLATAEGESSRVLATVPDPADGIAYIHWSPDDRRLRFTTVGPATQGLWEVAVDGRNLHEIQFNWPGGPMECCGQWTPDGRYFVFRSNRDGISNLWALEEKSDWWRRSNREPLQLTSGPVSYYQPLPSRNGRSIFAIGVQPSGELVRYDAKRKDFLPYLGGRSLAYLAFSHDTRWLAYVAYPEGTLWRARSDGTEQVQLTFPPLEVRLPQWSADDTQIAFDGKQPGQKRKSFVISADGGNPQPFPSESLSQASPDWMPGRSALIYSRAPLAENPGLYLFDMPSGRSEKIPGSDGLAGAVWSLNGRYLAARDSSAGDNLVLFDPKSGKRTSIVGATSTYWEIWSPDSQYVYFSRWGIDWIFRVHVPGGQAEKYLEVPFRSGPAFTVAPDGSLVLLRDQGRYDVYALSLALP